MAVGNANQTPSIVDWLEEEHGIPEEKAEDLLDYVRDYVEEQQSMDYAQALNRIVGELLSSPNVRLACAGLCYALSLDSVNGLGTMAQCAKRLCVTRASISKAAQQWRELLGDSHVSPHLKSQEARAAYSQSQIRKHWRRQTWKQQKP